MKIQLPKNVRQLNNYASNIQKSDVKSVGQSQKVGDGSKIDAGG